MRSGPWVVRSRVLIEAKGTEVPWRSVRKGWEILKVKREGTGEAELRPKVSAGRRADL